METKYSADIRKALANTRNLGYDTEVDLETSAAELRELELCCKMKAAHFTNLRNEAGGKAQLQSNGIDIIQAARKRMVETLEMLAKDVVDEEGYTNWKAALAREKQIVVKIEKEVRDSLGSIA